MEKSHEADNIFHFEELPLELQEHILIRGDDQILSTAMPLVSKFINNLVHDEGAVWRAKCRDYYTDSDWEILDELKKLDETWRQFYLRSKIRLFPLDGIDFKIKYSNLKDDPSAKNVTPTGMTYKNLGLCFFGELLSEITLANGTEKLPEHWEAAGLSWNTTFDDCKKLFEKWNATCLTQDSRGKVYKDLMVVKKEYDQFYQLIFFYESDLGPTRIHIRRQLFSRGQFNAGKPTKKNNQ